jgi:DNA-binding transcriptional LysR family regulator
MSVASTVLLNRLLARGKFRHAQVLLHLAELGSVQRAADAMGMTQSSVTQSLAYLEQLLESQLFHRHARGVRPTEVCQDLLPVVRQIVSGLGAGAEAVAARQQQGQGMVRLAASGAAINGLLLPALAAFGERHPRISVQLRELERDELLLLVTSGQADLAVCRRPTVVPSGWRFDRLVDDHLVVVCGPAHPLAGKRVRSWSPLFKATWLLPPVDSIARASFDEVVRGAGAAPATHPVVTRSLSALVWLLRQRPLLALLPYRSVRAWLDDGLLATVPLDTGAVLEPIGVLRPEQGARAAQDRLAEFLLAHAAPVSPASCAAAARA